MSRPDDCITERPGWRNLAVNPGDVSPISVPNGPRSGPGRGVVPSGEVDDLVGANMVGDERARGEEGRALTILVEGRLDLGAQVEGFDARAIEATTARSRACAARRQEGPAGREEAVEWSCRIEAGKDHPVAPFFRSSR